MSVTTPWCTLQRAVTAAPSGSVVLVRRGSYGTAELKAGARTGWVTLRAYTGETPEVSKLRLWGGYVAVERFRLGGGELTAKVRDVALRDNQITGGIVFQEGTTRVEVSRNRWSAPTSNAVIFSSAAGTEPKVTAITFRDNVFSRVGVVALNLRNFDDVVVQGNEFTNVVSYDGVVHADVIRTYAGGTRLRIVGNYLHDNQAQGIFTKDGRVDDMTIANNLVVRSGSQWFGMNLYDVTNLVMVNNTAVDNGGGDVVLQKSVVRADVRNNIAYKFVVVDPASVYYPRRNLVGRPDKTGVRFVDPSTSDYRLRPTSAGVDEAVADGSPAADLYGKGRADVPEKANAGIGDPNYVDIGAIETQP
ncbi:MAG: right-handed parallel beta-helix repeat-containing protein [Solirubrobacterales bacterium]|nr:right-handed parallel beta-helix repeat-containing protein [Solirubrobacterales bacterium]